MASRVRIGIDTREKALLDCTRGILDDLDEAVLNGVEFTPRALDMGDILVELMTQAGTSEEAVAKAWVFERKTVADLVSSIHDGRYREQKARLSAHYPRECITYVIEGLPCLSTWCSVNPENRAPVRYKSHFGSRSSMASIQGAIFNTLYRDGMHVIWSKDPEDTAAFIMAFALRIAHKPEAFRSADAMMTAGTAGTDSTGGGPSAYAHAMALKSRPKGNITPELCWRLMLCQIPDISSKLATSIAAKWPSMQALYHALAPLTKDERIQAFKAIPLVGPRKAAAIYANLFPDDLFGQSIDKEVLC